MRSRGLATLAAAGTVWALSAPAQGQSNDVLRQLADRYWDAAMEHSPTRATAIGDHRFNDRLADVSQQGGEAWKRTLTRLLREVNELPMRGLSAEDRLTRDLLERTIRDGLARFECHLEYMPLDPLYGPHIGFPLIIVSQPFRDVADFKAYVARLRAFPKHVTDTITNMRNGVRLGFVSPRVTIEKVIPQIRTHIVGDVTESELYKPVEKAGVLSEPDRKVVVAQIADAIASDVLPAYLQLLAYVEDEYLPACRSTVGFGALPNGDRVYNLLVRLSTTILVSPEEVHRLGLAEVARIRSEMAEVQAEIAFTGTLDEFLEHMRTDPRHRFNTREELVAAADAYLQRTKPLLPTLFGRLPKADCVMREIESFRAPSSPVAYYNLSPEDGTRPGYYYINTYAPKQRLRFTLEALTYHEAVPGHHLQMALDQENTALPKFRRYGRYTAYVEGWALYAEKLGYELGGYRDSYARFGQLTFEMWRACRLVIDTGLHHKGWSRRQAIDYMSDNASLTPIDIEAEVDRYISWPAQALAYKVGELRVLKLRKEAEEQLGDRFDLRAFHDALLSGGAMPIDMLEKRIREWIAAQRK